jgi:hypothetical protein
MDEAAMVPHGVFQHFSLCLIFDYVPSSTEYGKLGKTDDDIVREYVVT